MMRERIKRIIRKLQMKLQGVATYSLDQHFNVYEYRHSPGETWPTPQHPEMVMTRERLIASLEADEKPYDILAMMVVADAGGEKPDGRLFVNRLDAAAEYQPVGWSTHGPTLLDAAKKYHASVG